VGELSTAVHAIIASVDHVICGKQEQIRLEPMPRSPN